MFIADQIIINLPRSPVFFFASVFSPLHLGTVIGAVKEAYKTICSARNYPFTFFESTWMKTTFRWPITDHVQHKIVTFRYSIFVILYSAYGRREKIRQSIELKSSMAIHGILHVDVGSYPVASSHNRREWARNICMRIQEIGSRDVRLHFSADSRACLFDACFNRRENKTLESRSRDFVMHSAFRDLTSHLLPIRMRK